MALSAPTPSTANQVTPNMASNSARDCSLDGCPQERRISILERLITAHADRLHAGDIAIVKLHSSIERLSQVIERLEKRLDDHDKKLGATNPLVDKLKTSLVGWAVTLCLGLILWGLGQAGFIPGLTKAKSQEPSAIIKTIP